MEEFRKKIIGMIPLFEIRFELFYLLILILFGIIAYFHITFGGYFWLLWRVLSFSDLQIREFKFGWVQGVSVLFFETNKPPQPGPPEPEPPEPEPPEISSPLEQFAILPLIPMNIGNLYFSFTNPSLSMLLTLSLVLLLVHFVTKNGGGNSVPNAWQSLVELIHDFVPNPVNEQIGGLSGNVKQKFSPRISVTFFFSD